MKDLKTLKNLQLQKKEDIIAEILTSKLLITKMNRFRLSSYDKQDLESLILVYLLEMDADYFIDLVDRKKLDSYINRMLVLQYKSKTSKFHREIIKFQITTQNLDNYEE